MATEAEKIVELANAGAPFAHVVKTDEGREFLVVPDGFKHQDVTEVYAIRRNLPEFITQTVVLQTADSLVDYCNRYKGADTILFADIAANSIVAQVDYHGHDAANYVAHRASLKLEFSTEWAEWTKISGVLMDQLTFARFIEENGADVRAPDAAELLECVRDLQAHRKVNFTKAVRTSSDNENFEYSEETEAKGRRGGIEIPTKFKLGVPVYFGEPEAELFAFLRWRLGDGTLTLGIQIHRAEHVRQAIFKQIVLDVAAKTECPAVFGKI
jgi:uncharacterized protein YfdQ (DUF2303 family)